MPPADRASGRPPGQASRGSDLPGAGALIFAALAALASAFVKGAIGFGFPALATPLLALIMPVKIAIPMLIVPNLVMDGVQAIRLGGFLATARRMAALLAFGVVGTVVGTRLLVVLPARTAIIVIACAVIAFVAVNVTRFKPHVPPSWVPWVAPPVGFLAGITGGIANTPGLPLVIYFYSLRMDKPDFVRAVAFTFIIFKIIQLGAVTYYGLMTSEVLLAALGLIVASLGGFRLGLTVQDRLDPAAFNRAVLGFLAALGLWLLLRAAA